MTTEKDTRGSAFPCPHPSAPELGMTLRDYCMIHAPSTEIDGLIPPSIGELERYLDIPAGTYDYKTDYPRVLAKARGIWADAMIAEGSK